MNVPRVKALLAAVRAELDDIEKLVDADVAANDSPWMKVASYARHASVDPRTVLQWIDKADPGPGKTHPWATDMRTRNVRVHSVDADAWRKARR